MQVYSDVYYFVSVPGVCKAGIREHGRWSSAVIPTGEGFFSLSSIWPFYLVFEQDQEQEGNSTRFSYVMLALH